MKELIVIDGQQRLTTLTLIYLVIRGLARQLGEEELFDEISETYLINKYAPEDEKLKLRPTENNDKALKYLLRGDEGDEFKSFSKLIDNYTYFKSRITEENYTYVLDGLSKLMFVEISLDKGKDDPQRIFESLNSTGLELSQADLIRNYILMGLNRKDQHKVYHDYWEVIEKNAKDELRNISRVSDFIRDYLTLENRKIPNKDKVYLEFKAKYPTQTPDILIAHLSGFKKLVKHYNKLVNPDNESDTDIRTQIEYINRIEINVAYPFLMKVYDDYHSNKIDKTTFIGVFELIQTFAWRRFILSVPTNALNKIFMGLYDKVDLTDYLGSLKAALVHRSGTQRFPKDNEVLEALRTRDVYSIKSKNRLYFFDRLENYNNNERVSLENNPKITIEHIFPQNPDPQWKFDLGPEEYALVKDNYLNTIGNLTLSGNNGKLGNKPFKAKRDLPEGGYRDSRLWLNKYLADLEKWDSEEIENRFKLIWDRFLKIWPYPEVATETEEDKGEVNIYEAEDPVHKKLEYAIFLNQKIKVHQVSKLYGEVISTLFELQPDTFFTTDLAEKVVLVKKHEENKLRRPYPINDSYSIEANLDNKGKFDRIKYALTLFDLEDELLIKYAEE